MWLVFADPCACFAVAGGRVLTTSGDEVGVLPLLKMYRELHSDTYIDLDVKGTVYLIAVSFPLGGRGADHYHTDPHGAPKHYCVSAQG